MHTNTRTHLHDVATPAHLILQMTKKLEDTNGAGKEGITRFVEKKKRKRTHTQKFSDEGIFVEVFCLCCVAGFGYCSVKCECIVERVCEFIVERVCEFILDRAREFILERVCEFILERACEFILERVCEFIVERVCESMS